MRFLIDEDLPPGLRTALVEAGHDAVHVGDADLRGSSDTDVFTFAVRDARILLTADRGFGNPRLFSPAPPAGIVIFRFPAGTLAAAKILRAVEFVDLKTFEEFAGFVTILDPGGWRERRRCDSG